MATGRPGRRPLWRGPGSARLAIPPSGAVGEHRPGLDQDRAEPVDEQQGLAGAELTEVGGGQHRFGFAAAGAGGVFALHPAGAAEPFDVAVELRVVAATEGQQPGSDRGQDAAALLTPAGPGLRPALHAVVHRQAAAAAVPDALRQAGDRGGQWGFVQRGDQRRGQPPGRAGQGVPFGPVQHMRRGFLNGR